MYSSSQQLPKKTTFYIQKPTSFHRKKNCTRTFEQFYESRSKSFSIVDNIINMKSTQSNFIDKEFIDAIDQKTPKKRINQFIKRKVAPSTKMKTQQVQLLRDPEFLQNKRHLKIFSTVFNRERNKVLSKFQNNKEMRSTVYQKLGMGKPQYKPFFNMERNHIFSFEDRHRDVFRQYNSKNKSKHKKSMKKVHPLCEIYDEEAKNVLRNRSKEKNKTINFQPFGKIDYSAQYF